MTNTLTGIWGGSGSGPTNTDWVLRRKAALPGRTTTHRRVTEDEKGRCGDLGQIVEASIPEEPGALVPCAGACPELAEGICARAVGQLAVLPRCRLRENT